MKAEQSTLNKLSAKQERFCYEYLSCGMNATKAALKAGYSKKTAAFIGAENLKKPQIQNRISEMKKNLADTAGINALMIVNENKKIAFSSIANLHNSWIERKDFETLTDDEKACISEISSKIVKAKLQSGEIADIEFVKVKLYDKQKALDSLSNLLGFNAPTKHDFQGNMFLELMKSATSEPE